MLYAPRWYPSQIRNDTGEVMISTGGQKWIFLFSGGEAGLVSLNAVQRCSQGFIRDELWKRAISNYMLERRESQACLYLPVQLNTIVVLMFTNSGTWKSDTSPSVLVSSSMKWAPCTTDLVLMLGEWSFSMPDIQQASGHFGSNYYCCIRLAPSFISSHCMSFLVC